MSRKENKDSERFRNLIVFMVPATDAEFEWLGQGIAVCLVVVLVVVFLKTCSG